MVAWPSVFVTARSACGVTVSVSVALSLAGTGSSQPAGTVAVPVLVSEPLAELERVPATLNVATAPGASETVVARAFPLPDPASQEPLPLVIEQLQLTPTRAAGTVSATLAPETADGPLFVTLRT